jgi:Tfp pilus assembly protein PilF
MERVATGLAAVAVAVGVGATFSRMIGDAWEYQHYDDMSNYDRNPHIQSLSLDNLRWILTDGVLLSVFEPFSLTFKMLVRCLLGGSAGTNAFVSVVLHIINTLGAFLLALSTMDLFLTPPIKGDKKVPKVAVECCGMAALLMGIHPLRVQAVAWLSCQPYLLASGLCNLALFCHITHRTQHSQAWKLITVWKAVGIAAYACACTAKAAAIPLALVFVLYDVFLLVRQCDQMRDVTKQGGEGYQKQSFWQIIRSLAAIVWKAVCGNMPALCIGAVVAYTTIRAASSGQQMDKEWNEMHHLDTWQRVLRASYAVGFYLWKTAAPISLSVRYMVPLPETIILWHGGFGASMLLVVVVSLSVLWTQLKIIAGSKIDRIWSVLGFGWGVYLVLLLPTLGLFSDHVQTLAADRYCYIPAMMVGVPLLSRLLQIAHRRSALWLRTAVIAIIAVLAQRTRVLVDCWSTNLSMWRSTIEVNPNDHLAHFNLAVSYQAEAGLIEAVDHYTQAIQIKPDYAVAYKNMALALNDDSRHTEAAEQCKRAVAILPNYFEGHLVLGNSLSLAGNTEGSTSAFEKAVLLSPTNAGATANLGVSLHSSGRLDEAISFYQQALQLSPSLGVARNNLQIALRARGSDGQR